MTEGTETILVRARNELGQFIPDDPSTPENEAWIEKQIDP